MPLMEHLEQDQGGFGRGGKKIFSTDYLVIAGGGASGGFKVVARERVATELLFNARAISICMEAGVTQYCRGRRSGQG